MAELIKAGGFGGFGLTEREHGSDLLASGLVAEPDGDDFVVSGTKWPINNATRGTLAALFAKTGSGPRGFSMLLLDKERSAADRWHNEPRVPTMGLRGCDFSGLTFERYPFPAESVIGKRGRGLRRCSRHPRSPAHSSPRCLWARPIPRSGSPWTTPAAVGSTAATPSPSR